MLVYPKNIIFDYKTYKLYNQFMNKINKDWKEVKLGDIGVFLRGFGISKKDLSDSGTPAIRYGDIYTKYDFIIKNISSFTNSKGTELKKGDILFAGSGETIAEIGKLVAFIDDFKALAGGDIIIFRPSIELDSAFLSYMLNTGKCRRDISVMGQGVIIAHISSKSLQKLSVFLPSLEEQKRIASALSKIDAYLENTIKLIEEKERFKRGIAKKLLTCKEGENIPEARFKGFNDDWRKEKLSSMIKIQGGYAFKSSEFKKSGIPIIRISNISNTDNNMNMKEVVYYNEIENEKSFIIKKSDLLIALSGAPGKSSIYNLEEKAYLNQRVGLFKIIDTKKINNSFLSQYVFSSIFQNKLKPFITRGVQPNISPKDIENLDILLPSLKEQEKIGGYLSLLDAEIDNLKKQKELIKEMKRGAMQKLLSGEVRLLE